MTSTLEQQPIFRTVGIRQTRDGVAPSHVSMKAQANMASYTTRVPKGLFFYNSHQEMEKDRLHWTLDLIQSKAT